jgi:hypothetical protein
MDLRNERLSCNSSKKDRSIHIVVTVCYSVSMNPVLPMRTIRSRTETLWHITGGRSDRWIARDPRRPRLDLSGQSWFQSANRSSYSQAYISGVDRLTRRHPDIRCKYLALVVEQLADFPSVSKCAVHKVHLPFMIPHRRLPGPASRLRKRLDSSPISGPRTRRRIGS